MRTAPRRLLPTAATTLLVLAGTLAIAGDRSRPLPDHGPNVVAQWHALGAATITGANPAGVPPATPEETAPGYDLDMATLHVAIYDALANASFGHRPVKARVAPRLWHHLVPQEYIVHGAACTVMGTLYPSRFSYYQPTCDAARNQNAKARLLAFDLGTQVAAQVLAWRANDGRLTPLPPFVDGTLPGEFRNLNPAASPINRTRPYVTPFSMHSPSQFRAPGPPALASGQYAADVMETRELGSATSTVRSDFQSTNARFHTMPPPLFWTSNYQQFATSRPTLAQNARLMAALWMGQADGSIACFESKYHFLLWRPVQAIRMADLDGNPATDPADPAWAPFLPTPNHPEYPAAHSCLAGVTAEILEHEFGSRLSFTFSSTVTATQQEYESPAALVSTIGQARLAGGMHFRSATVDGARQGRKVAWHLLRKYFGSGR
jgi:hypothetical protein